MKLVLIVLIILTALALGMGYLLCSFAVGIRRQTLEDARKWQEEHYDISWYDGLEKEDYTVTSYDGYLLHAQLLRNPAPSDRYILISHGYTDNRFGSLKYTKMYLDQGFHVILYDLRGHGENEPTFCTYSIRESRDLDVMIRDSRARHPEASLFGIHGESLGSATSVAVLRYKPRIDFVVADCGFSEIESVMRRGLRGMHVPGFMICPASLWAKARCGYFFREMRPIDSLADNLIPILFIHGAEDDFILPAHSEAMRKATRGYSELHLIPGAGHAASVLTAPDDYARYTDEFIRHVEAMHSGN